MGSDEMKIFESSGKQEQSGNNKEHDRIDELIEKQMLREAEMRQLYKDYVNEIGEEIPKKQITVKLFPNTHKKLKIIAASKDTTLETVATSILEDKLSELNIVKYVKISFDKSEKLYGWLQRTDIDNSAYDLNDKLLNKGNPRKRINVKVSLETHKKLRVVSAIQDRSLDKIVSSIIEYEIGEKNNIDTSKLMDEILESMEDKE